MKKIKNLVEYSFYAEVAELADASVSKTDGGNPVWVRVPPSAFFICD